MLLRLINIKTRLIAAFLILSFIPLLVIGTFSYNKSSKAIESKAENYSTELLKQVGNNVKTEMVKLNSVFNDILISKEMTDLLNSYSANSSSKVEAEIAIKMLISKKLSLINGATGAQIRVGNEKIDFGSTGLSEEQAESAAEAAKSSSGSLNFKSDVSGGENVFVVMKEVKAREVQGVFLVTLKEEVLSVGYKDVDLGSNAGILIVDKEGKVVSSADSKRFPVNAAFENIALAGYLQNDSQEAKNAVSLEVGGEKCLVGYSAIEGTDWYMIGTIPYKYLQSESRSIGGAILIVAFFCIALALILSLVISRSISKPLDNLVKVMEKAKEGNLSLKLQDNNRDELSRVINNFNNMIEKIRFLISKVNHVTTTVVTNTGEMLSLSERSREASEQITLTIQQIANGASDQADDTTESVNHMEKLSEQINQVKAEIDEITSIIRDTKDLSHASNDIIGTLSKKSEEAKAVTGEIVEDIQGLSSGMKEIGKILSVIVGISEQTNLLSLNAAIEAARAGEAGRGFSVVAEEVKKLSEQTRESTTVIGNIIKNIQGKTVNTVKITNTASSIINGQTESVMKTGDAFKEILNRLGKINTKVSFMDSSVRNVLESKAKVLESITNISAVSEETAATIEEVSAGTQEQLAGSEEVARNAKELNATAEELSQLISTFNVT